MNNQNQLELFIFDVGQGDHTLFRLPNRKYAIIDSHYDKTINYPREPPGLTYLKNRKAKGETVEIAFIHISHYHEDHIKGFDEWVKWIRCEDIPVDKLWLPGTTEPKEMEFSFRNLLEDKAIKVQVYNEKNTTNSRKLEKLIAKKNKYPFYLFEYFKETKTQIEYLNSGSKKSRYFVDDNDDTLTVDCFSPDSATMRAFFDLAPLDMLKAIICNRGVKKGIFEQNQVSIVLQFQFETFRLLFGGDAAIAQVETFLTALTPVIKKNLNINFESDFIKVFHHGAASSTSELMMRDFIKSKGATSLAISAKESKYGRPKKSDGHPRIETLEIIDNVAQQKQKANPRKKVKAEIYATNRSELDPPKTQYIKETAATFSLGFRNRPTGKHANSVNTNASFIPGEVLHATPPSMPNKLGYHFSFNPTKQTVSVKQLVTR